MSEPHYQGNLSFETTAKIHHRSCVLAVFGWQL